MPRGNCNLRLLTSRKIDVDQINEAYERIPEERREILVRYQHGQNKMTCAGLDGMFLSNSC
jgi:hypothetical protein